MRQLDFGVAPTHSTDAKLDWIIRALKTIENATNDPDYFRSMDEYTVTNHTASRTFDADTVTLAELADVIGTMIDDAQKRGSKRTG